MSAYILLKPETASRCLGPIVHFVRSECPGAQIATKTVILSEADILSLYGDDMHPLIKSETVKRLAGVPLVVIQISGDALIVNRIAALRGSNVDANKCEPGTIRKMLAGEFSCHPVDLGENQKYWPNFVHIAQDSKEESVSEGLFGKYFVK